MNYKITTQIHKLVYTVNKYALHIEFMHGDGDDYDVDTSYAESPYDFDEIIEFLLWYDRQPWNIQRDLELTDFKPLDQWSEQMQDYIEYGDSFIPKDKFSNYSYNARINDWSITYFDDEGNEWSVDVNE